LASIPYVLVSSGRSAKRLIVTVVIPFVIKIARQYHVDGAWIEVSLRDPGHGGNIQSEPGSIETHGPLFTRVIQMHVEAPGQTDENLLERLVGVSAPDCPTGNVIDVEDTPDLERDMLGLFNEREIPGRILDLREF